MNALWRAIILTTIVTFRIGVNVSVNGLKCPPPSNGGNGGEGKEETIFDFGHPVIFVSTSSQRIDPYSIINKHRRTSIPDEYLMVGYEQPIQDSGGITAGVYELLQIVIIDEVENIEADVTQSPDLIHQNLEKELYWKLFNSTGVYPAVTIENSTFRTRLQFHTHVSDETGYIAFFAELREKHLFNEPQLPYDAIFEIPSQSNVLRKQKTFIQYQAFSLWRWKLSNVTVTWDEILEQTNQDDSEGIKKEFERIDNPCTKDLFLLHSTRRNKTGGKPAAYLASPLIQSHLKENWFYDMTTPDLPWGDEVPLQFVLTNDHLVVLTDGGVYVSNSLNVSKPGVIDMTMKTNCTLRPLLEYESVNPCEKFNGSFSCFVNKTNETDSNNNESLAVNTDINKSKTNHTTPPQTRLFYNPVCYLNQVPFYDDYMTFVIRDDKKIPHHFTILYAPTPYKEWNVLFANLIYYRRFVFVKEENRYREKRYYIQDIVGIIFNHHMSHFDITVALSEEIDSMPSDHDWVYMRFYLTVPGGVFDGYGTLVDLHPEWNPTGMIIRELNTIAHDEHNRFRDFEFPGNVRIDKVIMNEGNSDIYFLGNQFWIAEAGGPYPYFSFGGVPYLSASPDQQDSNEPKKNYSSITDCSFNHPDRSYICETEDPHLYIGGKMGSVYSPTVVKVDDAAEVQQAAISNGWTPKFTRDIIEKYSIMVPAFSGRLCLWYLYDPKLAAQEFDSGGNEKDCEENKVLCEKLKKYKEKGCKPDPPTEPDFRMFPINPPDLKNIKQNMDGPLAPFLVDANTAVLFEGVVPMEFGLNDKYMYHTYLGQTNVGQRIYCDNHNISKEDINDPYAAKSCELFIRHLNKVSDYLHGFRQSIYVTVIKSIPMLPLPVNVVVLVFAKSNRAIIKADGGWKFSEAHIGQTLYLPRNFSILLTGFPNEADKSIMGGYSTMYSYYENRLVYPVFSSYLLDLSTEKFRMVYNQERATQLDKQRLEKINAKLMAKHKAESETRSRMLNKWNNSYLPKALHELFQDEPSPYVSRGETEAQLMKINDTEKDPSLPSGGCKANQTGETAPKKDWHLAEGKCNFVLSLEDNAVLKGHGGRISLDLHDSVSFLVVLRSTNPLGKVMMHRPLLLTTNSNPNLLHVNKEERLNQDPQFLRVTLSPTGYGKGTAVISIRLFVRTLNCEQSSITYTVLLHREAGRRLYPRYPIPTCKPQEDMGMFPRPFYEEIEGCITREELLHDQSDEIYRYRYDRKHIAYVTLPQNYRPPSFDGVDIPLSRNIYNADPAHPPYKTWYRVSKQTFHYEKCSGKKTKGECGCTENDRLLDDEYLTECKSKVFYTHRTGTGKPLLMYMDYDRVMRDKDQHSTLFTPKVNWSIKIEEINGRTEWYITSETTVYLSEINTNPYLHQGIKHYDMKRFYITFLGTGLFHFKATLASFESFDEVTGYFMMYVSTDEIHSIHLFLIILGTFLLCITLVFIGFLAVRKRLSRMLPVQTMSQKKQLKLL